MTSPSAAPALTPLAAFFEPWWSPNATERAGDRALDEIEALGLRCRAGEAAAWEELFPQIWPLLVRFVHRLYGSFEAADAEDVAQLTLEAAMRSAGTFSGRGPFRGWLFGIAARQASNHHRALTATKRGAGRVEPLNLEVELHASTQPAPDEILSARERAEILHEALEDLPPTERELIQLRFFGDLSCEEIAQVCRLHPKNVATRLHRARRALLVHLRRRHLTRHDG
ncbi:MAG: sigma-70 family RNA polymerase sigma factor [Verrucomicrobia bacterium]|nr:sigma-70 family RNA polymerase sigma factor [Verrucomicrobiota bacterium]